MIRLKNNFKIHQIKTSSDIIHLQLNIDAGSMFDELSHLPIGTSHFLEHMSLNGSERYPLRKDLLGLIINNAGKRKSWTSHYYQGHEISIHKKHIKEALIFLCESVFYPKLDAQKIEKEREIILKEYQERISKRKDFDIENVYPSFFNNLFIKNYSLGNQESINQITQEDLQEFHKKCIQPKNCSLFISGNINENETIDLIKNIFSSLKNNKLDIPEINLSQQKEDRQNKTSAKENNIKINISYLLPKQTFKSYLPYLFLSQILSHDIDSRLFIKLREEKALTYNLYPKNLYNPYVFIFGIEMIVNREKIESVIKIITDEIKNIADNGVDSSELGLKKKKFFYKLIELHDSTKLWQDLQIKHYRQFGKVFSLGEIKNIIEKINPLDIQEAAGCVIKQESKISFK